MVTLDFIKEKLELVDDPSVYDWPENAKNYWITRQSLINKGNVAVEFYAENMRQLTNNIIQTDGVRLTDEYDCIFFTVDENDVIVCTDHKEIKMATVKDNISPDDHIRLNQIRKNQNWQYLVAVLIFSDREEIYEISKEKYLAEVLNNADSRIVPIAGNTNAIQLDIKYKLFQDKFDKIPLAA